MSKPTVFVLDPYHADAIELLTSSSTVEAVLKTDPRCHTWREEADGIMIRSDTRITASDLAEAKKLKVIVKQGVGVDNVDLEAARHHGIVVCNTPAMNAETVAELTLSLALCVARRVVEMDRKLLRGEALIRSQLLGQSLYGKAIGIVGMGNVGRQVALKWSACMQGNIVAFDPFAPNGAWDDIPHRRVLELGALLQAVDVVTLHVPLTDETNDMIGKQQFAQMKPNAILLNCARGGIVDEEALLEALSSNKIYGAALDAVEDEPPTLETYKRLLACDNLIITPHVGAATEDNQRNTGRYVVETMLAVLEGSEVPNRVV